MKYENQILDAIETIVDKRVDTAKYDKTIQATILNVENAAIGKYKVQWQDSIFYAYSISAEINYNPGSEVYILVPENDMSRNKTILGSVNGLGQTYISTPETGSSFETIGSNCIENNESFELCSYDSSENQIYMLYNKTSGINLVNLNETSVETYIKNASSILLAMTVKTDLPIAQQIGGVYGITYELAFMNNSVEETTFKEYTLDVNQFEGNPYVMNNPTKQQIKFDIDTENFLYINKIYLFCRDFPNSRQSDDEFYPNDIFISNLELYASKDLSVTDLESYVLSFNTPQGVYFDTGDSPTSTRLIEAQIKVKGKDLGQEAQNLPYYWFIEDNSVTTVSDYYYSYGGQGWKCLNNKVEAVDEATNTSVIRWVPASYQYLVAKSDCKVKETKYKCIVIYNNIVLSKTFTIIDYSSVYDITISSDQGTEFYYDIGDPTLTCSITMNQQALDPSLCRFQWAMVDSNDIFSFLLETVSENNRYHTAVTNYTNLLQQIAEEEVYAAASQDQLNEYLSVIKACNAETRIESNHIYHLQVNTISNYSTYKCSVYYNEIYIGTASITISNDLTKNQGYTVVIDNSSQLFKYNIDGVAPTSKSLDNPQTLMPLSCTMYNALGQSINDDVMSNCTIEWMFPAENSLLILPSEYDYDIVENYKVIKNKNLSQITYEIQDKYNVNYTNNNIRLKIKYKDIILVAETDFTFSKEGNLSISGTDIVCKIVPNSMEIDNTNFIPMILNGQLNFAVNPNINQQKWFNVEVWKNGNRIYNNYTSGSSSDNQDVEIKWEILKNSYADGYVDVSDISVTEDGSFTYLSYHATGISPANIIKATVVYNNIAYYATLPLITATTESGYGISLNNSGFNKVIYNINQKNPQYNDAKPFELKVTEIINGNIENITLLTKTHSVTYEWQIKGNKYNVLNHTLTAYEYLLKNEEIKNILYCSPIDSYDGQCVNIGLECLIRNINNQIVAKIHIPIHFYLQYQNKNKIEKWSGNALYLNENNYDIALAPEVGIGYYDDETGLSGTFIGDVKQENDEESQSGFFVYSNGIRSAFYDAKHGYSIIGKKNSGKFLIDPIEDKAMLFSHSYWKNYLSNGIPTSYENNNLNGQGILIDLNNALIKHGNGKFLLDSNGYTGKAMLNEGTISGFNIYSNELTNTNGTVHLESTGTLRGPNWTILGTNGYATFDNIKITSNGSSAAATDKLIEIGNFSLQKNGYTTIAHGNIRGNLTANENDLTIIDDIGRTYTIKQYIQKIIDENNISI